MRRALSAEEVSADHEGSTNPIGITEIWKRFSRSFFSLRPRSAASLDSSYGGYGRPRRNWLSTVTEGGGQVRLSEVARPE
jgi:hypothetical protein